MPYIKQEIYSGDVYEGIQTFSTRFGKKEKRNAKTGRSSDKQKIINEKNAKRKVARLINSNFTKGDIFITLTYEGETPNEVQARKDLVNFFRRIKYFRKKNELPDVKYIAVTETESRRIHHHVIMSAMSLDTVTELWNKGQAIMSRLSPNQDYTGIAKYITKEPAKAFSKRWTQSRNLKKPVIKTRVLKTGRNLLSVPKGYKIIEQKLDYTEWTGNYQYIRAIRIGGMDYCEGWQAGADDGPGVPENDREARPPAKVRKQKD